MLGPLNVQGSQHLSYLKQLQCYSITVASKLQLDAQALQIRL